MTDIDMLLDRVRAAPVPSRLAALDNAVFDALAAHAAASDGLGARPIGMAALAALAIGLLGALPGAQVEAAPLSPLGDVALLAPSTLLDSAP